MPKHTSEMNGRNIKCSYQILDLASDNLSEYGCVTDIVKLNRHDEESTKISKLSSYDEAHSSKLSSNGNSATLSVWRYKKEMAMLEKQQTTLLSEKSKIQRNINSIIIEQNQIKHPIKRYKVGSKRPKKTISVADKIKECESKISKIREERKRQEKFELAKLQAEIDSLEAILKEDDAKHAIDKAKLNAFIDKEIEK